MSSPFLRRTITITLENASWAAIKRNIEAQQRVIDGLPLRPVDHAPLLDTRTVLEAIERAITE